MNSPLDRHLRNLRMEAEEAARQPSELDRLREAASFALKLIDDSPDEGASPLVVTARQMLRAALAKGGGDA